jgi:hypothetical protein
MAKRWLVVLVGLAWCAPAKSAEQVPLWGRWERAFTAAKGAAERTELLVELTSPSGKAHSAPGFWDGGLTWRVRFRPTEKGTWKWRSRSRPAVAGLDAQSGSFACRPSPGADNPFLRHGPLRVAKARTYLEHADGTPFFWLGDTVWTGPARSTKADWADYLRDRAAKRFSAVQFHTLCPWRTAATDRRGQVAFTGKKDVRINPAYFQRLDRKLDAINAHGLLAVPVLLWANKKTDPGNYLPEEDLVRLARYQVARYAAHHVVWVLAGDNPYRGADSARWKRVGRAVFGDSPHAPVTTHPTGMNWPWEGWRAETWLDVLGYQSGHGDDRDTLRWLHSGPPHRNWGNKPVRPVVNLEPPYEDHLAYHSRKPHPALHVRRAVYWSLLSAPPAGVTYGAHGLWSWQTEPGKTPPDHPYTGKAKTWRRAKDLPGAEDMKHLAELFATLEWWRLRPAGDRLADQPGAKDPAKFVAAARTPEGDLALAYLPAGGKVTLRPRAPGRGLTAEWFDPRTGKRSPAKPAEGATYEAPDGHDWLLVLRKPGGKTALGVRGTQFTVNGRPTFLLGVSYYGALGAPREVIARDLDEMSRRGFNWLRVWATWSAFGQDVSAVDPGGRPRPEYLRKLARLVGECDRRGLVVDVTLSRGNGVTGRPRLQTLEAHERAAETLTRALAPYTNWYLDLSNERNVRDRRFTDLEDLKKLRERVRELDPRRLVTASHAGDMTRAEVRDYVRTVGVDFLAPHRPRHAKSAGQTEAKTREYLAWMKGLGRAVPVHYQEPFRRGFGAYRPKEADFLADVRGARAGGAAGWCFHNGDARGAEDGHPRRCFDLREKSLFEQLDAEERRALRGLRAAAGE